MTIENILIIAVAIIVSVIIIRFVTKVLAKLIAIAIVVIALYYILFQWNGGLLNLGKNQFIVYDLEEKYCHDEEDLVKCNCIILPLKADIESKYTPEELETLNKDRMEALKIFYKSIEENSQSIKACLEENNSGSAWKEFMEDIKSSPLKKKLNELMGKEEEEFPDAA
ncbi:MAG: hypothetical protein K9H49_19620 [Bacteroidales bacterium]|nr:hypothetical protein [Bacteroidales bacterium]MCF8391976.1 hypothetical protein [Bacteroidales bacterium]